VSDTDDSKGKHYVGDVLRPTLVYLRDQRPGEPTALVPADLHLPAGRAIRALDGSSRELLQISLYNGAWYAEPKERRRP
jgi:hypothetical protein